MAELTNTEFAAHLRVAAKMMDCEDNYGNPIVPGIVRSLRKAADIIDAGETKIAALQSENAEMQERLDKVNDFEKTQCAKLLEKLSRVEAERDAAVALVDKVHEMLRPGEDGHGYGYAATNSVAYMVYAMIDEWRGAQGEASQRNAFDDVAFFAAGSCQGQEERGGAA